MDRTRIYEEHFDENADMYPGGAIYYWPFAQEWIAVRAGGVDASHSQGFLAACAQAGNHEDVWNDEAEAEALDRHVAEYMAAPDENDVWAEVPPWPRSGACLLDILRAFRVC